MPNRKSSVHEITKKSVDLNAGYEPHRAFNLAPEEKQAQQADGNSREQLEEHAVNHNRDRAAHQPVPAHRRISHMGERNQVHTAERRRTQK